MGPRGLKTDSELDLRWSLAWSRAEAVLEHQGCLLEADKHVDCARTLSRKSKPSSCRLLGRSRCLPLPRSHRPPGLALQALRSSSSQSRWQGPQPHPPQPLLLPLQPLHAERSCSGALVLRALLMPRAHLRAPPGHCLERLRDHPWQNSCHRGRRRPAAEPSTWQQSSSSYWAESARRGWKGLQLLCRGGAWLRARARGYQGLGIGSSGTRHQSLVLW